jgi:hypothetical protein
MSPQANRYREWVACGVLAIGLIACNSRSAIDDSQSSGIRGSLKYVGGPAPGRPRQPAPGQVIVYSPTGDQVASAIFSEGEGFTFFLKPGIYRLSPSSGDARCSDLSVSVVQDQIAHVPITCDVV